MSTEGVVVVKNAIKLIEKHGWIQRSLGSPGVGFCLMGALSYAEKERVDYGIRIEGFAEAVKKTLCSYYDYQDARTNVVRFNDDRCKSKSEAIAFLETLAKKLPRAKKIAKKSKKK